VFFAATAETAVLSEGQLEWDRDQDLPVFRPRPVRRCGRKRH
jgi:hypothetical protein